MYSTEETPVFFFFFFNLKKLTKGEASLEHVILVIVTDIY